MPFSYASSFSVCRNSLPLSFSLVFFLANPKAS